MFGKFQQFKFINAGYNIFRWFIGTMQNHLYEYLKTLNISIKNFFYINEYLLNGCIDSVQDEKLWKV